MPCPGRVGAGFAALALSVIAGTGGLLALRHPVARAAVIFVCGLAVAVAIDPLYINTYYVLAVRRGRCRTDTSPHRGGAGLTTAIQACQLPSGVGGPPTAA